jgi:hypothetical protein
MSPAAFQTALPASEWAQTQALDRVATEIGCDMKYFEKQHKIITQYWKKTFSDKGLCSNFFQSNIYFILLA